MSARSTLLHLAAKAGLVLAALFAMTVLLAAMPGHHTTAVQNPASQESPAPQPQEMPGMEMSDEKASEKDAVHDMNPGHHGSHNLHMTLTAMRTQTPEDIQRAEEIVAELREGIEKYKDYRAALNDGYKIFLPNLPLPEYHFTNYRNGFMEAFTFDPARPTSLLYKKTGTGYELVGAMYTMSVSHRRLVQVWPEGFHRHERRLRHRRRPLPALHLRLDGPRLSVRGFARQNLRHASPRGLTHD